MLCRLGLSWPILLVLWLTGCGAGLAVRPNRASGRTRSKARRQRGYSPCLLHRPGPAPETVEIRARVTGYLFDIGFAPGNDVTKGQRLFKIDPRPYQAQLDQANAQIRLAQTQLNLARADLARAREVAKTPGAISRADMDKFIAAEAEAQAQLEAQRANAEIAKLNLEFTDVTSPIEGIAGRYLLTIGNLIQQDTTVLTTVVSQDPMWVYFDIDEQSLLTAQQLIREGKIKPIAEGGQVAVDIGLANEGNSYPHEGRLDFVNNQVTPDTGTIQLRAVLENPKLSKHKLRLFRPGMFVRVRLPMGTPERSLLVSQAALGTNQGRPFLFVVNQKNVIEYRPIELGPEQPGGMQVVRPVEIVRTASGVRPGKKGEKVEPSITAEDLVVVEGLQRARPGEVVIPKPLEPEFKSVARGGD